LVGLLIPRPQDFHDDCSFRDVHGIVDDRCVADLSDSRNSRSDLLLVARLLGIVVGAEIWNGELISAGIATKVGAASLVRSVLHNYRWAAIIAQLSFAAVLSPEELKAWAGGWRSLSAPWLDRRLLFAPFYD
jgi:hypothetical protein